MDTDKLVEVFSQLSEPKSLFVADKDEDHYFGTRNYWNQFTQSMNGKFPLLIFRSSHVEKLLLKITSIIAPNYKIGQN